MRIKTQDYNDVTVVDLHGDFDCDSVDSFENSITDIISHHKVGIVLDMSDIVFIDSEALERLLWARDYCIKNNCQLNLAGLDGNCRKILEITRLEHEFDCYAELAKAVKSFV